MTKLAKFPAHWQNAAKRVGVALSGQLFEGRGNFSHLVVEFDLGEHRDWASTALLSDFLRGEYVEDRFGLPRGTTKNVLVMYVSLNPLEIPREHFHVRYPDVPYKQAHDFVLLHEVGHALKGNREAVADEYAFARLLMPQDPAAKAVRDSWYAKMKDPFEMIGFKK